MRNEEKKVVHHAEDIVHTSMNFNELKFITSGVYSVLLHIKEPIKMLDLPLL